MLYLPSVDSTNLWAKEHLDQLSPMGAVWTTSQTQGRGRLGRPWINAAGRALYYTVAYTQPLAQPAALSLFASLAVAQAIQEKFQVEPLHQVAQRPAAQRQKDRGNPLRGDARGRPVRHRGESCPAKTLF